MKKDKLCELLAIFLLSAIFGYIYEVIFYYIDLGYLTNRGITFGPWVPIYGIGSIFIYLFTKKIKNKPLLIFLLSIIITGLLEYFAGYILDVWFNTRLWDYNVEIWNFGNINGYVCLRSVLFFGISSLLLMYIIVPFVKRINRKKSYQKVIYILFSIFLIDFIVSSIKFYGN